jgi:hypothetical protein
MPAVETSASHLIRDAWTGTNGRERLTLSDRFDSFGFFDFLDFDSLDFRHVSQVSR